MGKPDLQTTRGDSPHTRCSNCETVFEVSPELLSSADTRVRCGECLSIFDALANLCSLPPELSVVGGTGAGGAPDASSTHDASSESFDNEDFYSARDAARPDSAAGNSPVGAANRSDDQVTNGALELNDLDATYADFDLFSGDAELPEVAYFEQAEDLPDLGLEQGESDHDETFSDTLFVRDAAIDVDNLSDLDMDADRSEDEIERIEEEEGVPREDLVFNYRDSNNDSAKGDSKSAQNPNADKRVADGVVAAEGFLSSSGAPQVRAPLSRSPWLFRALLGLSLTLLLSALFTYRHRDELHNNVTIRPLLLGVCSVVGCTVPARVDIDQLKMLKRSISSHSEIDEALTIELAFENTADFAQRYPTLVIRLSDTAGSLVARREFPPADYAKEWDAVDTLGPNERVDVTLEIRDPGANAMSLELQFEPF